MVEHMFVVNAEVLMNALGALRRAKFELLGITPTQDVDEAIAQLCNALQPENTADHVFTYQGQRGKELEASFDGFDHGTKVYIT